MNYFTKASIKETPIKKQDQFDNYIDRAQARIIERRLDLFDNQRRNKIVLANSPYAIYPNQKLSNQKYSHGVLLVHGLFDSPFSMLEIAHHLKTLTVPSKAILLAGHGTKPEDLLTVSYSDWMKEVAFGVEMLKKEVEKIFIIGYSTGAALAMNYALNHAVDGLILIAPALSIKIPRGIVKVYQSLKKIINKNDQWIFKGLEDDYIKYRSLPFNPVFQLENLSDEIYQKTKLKQIDCPIFMILSEKDETISTIKAFTYFKKYLPHTENQLLLYTSHLSDNKNPKIIERFSQHKNLHIQNYSHIGLPFSPQNSHYGWEGDFPFIPHLEKKDHLYGAYNRFEMDSSNFLYHLHLSKHLLRPLTFNPDFDFMVDRMGEFILKF